MGSKNHALAVLLPGKGPGTHSGWVPGPLWAGAEKFECGTLVTTCHVVFMSACGSHNETRSGGRSVKFW